MVFRCNKCVKVFRTRSELQQHHEVDHGRVKLTDVQGEKYPCLRCHREFFTESIFVIHSRDHKENVMLVMNAYCTLTLLQVWLSIARIYMTTGTMLAQLVGKFLVTTPICAGTPHHTTLNFVMSAAELCFR